MHDRRIHLTPVSETAPCQNRETGFSSDKTKSSGKMFNVVELCTVRIISAKKILYVKKKRNMMVSTSPRA